LDENFMRIQRSEAASIPLDPSSYLVLTVNVFALLVVYIPSNRHPTHRFENITLPVSIPRPTRVLLAWFMYLSLENADSPLAHFGP
jgi:hypothetical protein